MTRHRLAEHRNVQVSVLRIVQGGQDVDSAVNPKETIRELLA